MEDYYSKLDHGHDEGSEYPDSILLGSLIVGLLVSLVSICWTSDTAVYSLLKDLFQEKL